MPFQPFHLYIFLKAALTSQAEGITERLTYFTSLESIRHVCFDFYYYPLSFKCSLHISIVLKILFGYFMVFLFYDFVIL